MNKLRDLKILVAEDDINFLEVLSMSLERHGANVTGAKNGKSALEFFEAGSYDLIISDVQMPLMTGTEFLKAVRQKNMTSPTFILITGHSHVNEEQCMSMGASAVAVKPFKLTELLLLIDSLM